MKNEDIHFDEDLDTSGLLCPYPLLRAKKVLTNIPKGRILRVISTDPSSVIDFKAYTSLSGNTLLGSRVEEGKYYFFIRKGELKFL
jgi:tRNA 2-thiouridine synthesizing protein A